MSDKPDMKENNNKRKNIHNFSWFPSVLLLFQLFLLLFGLFKFEHEIVDSFNHFLQDSSLFLSIINGLLIFWYWIKDNTLKQQGIRKEFKIINSCICVANIVLLNKLYENDKINDIFDTVKNFFSSENIVIYVFALIIIVAIILIVRYARKADKNAPPDKKPPASPADPAAGTQAPDDDQPPASSTAATGSAQPQEASVPITQSSTGPKDASANVLFLIILIILILVIAVVAYILIDKYDIVTNIIKDADESYKILTYLYLAISVIAVVLLSIIIVTAMARSISRLIMHVPEYIRRADVSEDRLIKIALGIVLIPAFYGITKLFGINTDWILNLLQNQNFLVVPFTMLFYFILAMLLVELLWGLFFGEPRAKWLNGFKAMVSSAGDNVLKICGSILDSFFRLINIVPDFLKLIQMVLFGEDDEKDDTKNK